MKKIVTYLVCGVYCIAIFCPRNVYAVLFSITDTGGDCGSSLWFASTTWNSDTHTCAFTDDLLDLLDIRIDADDVTLDGGGHGVTSSAISVTGHTGVTIQNINLDSSGITIQSATSTVIDSVHVTGGTYGITISNSSGMQILNSSVTDASGYGLAVYGDTRGLFMRNTSFVQTSPAYGFTTYHQYIYAQTLENMSHVHDWDIDSSNTVDGHRIYYFENLHDTVLGALDDVGIFYCTGCHNVTLSHTVFQSTHARNLVSIYGSTGMNVQGNTIQRARESGLYVYASPETRIEGNTFKFNTTGVTLTLSSSTLVQGNLFSDNSGLSSTGLYVSNGNEQTRVVDNTFANNTFGLVNQSEGVTLVHNTFRNNMRDVDNYVASTTFAESLPVGGNYWSVYDSPDEGCVDGDGPEHTGDGVCDAPYRKESFGSVVLDPLPWSTSTLVWSGSAEIASSTQTGTSSSTPLGYGHSNILFVPGLEASRLFADDGTRLWEPSGDADVQRLYGTPNGIPVEEGIVARDIIDHAYVPLKGNIYESFISDMDQLRDTGSITDWKAFAYDWRAMPESIVSSGTVPNIVDMLETLASTSQTRKVTIVAHSNGGLVVKVLTEMLGSRAQSLIDTIIFVAVPQSGSVKAVGALLHGFNQSIGSVFIGGDKMSTESARILAGNMPAAYNLLPSHAYFSAGNDTAVSDTVVTFLDTDLQARYGRSIQSKEQLTHFILDSSRDALFHTHDLNYPAVGNTLLEQAADIFHSRYDTWSPPAGIRLHTIAGWGKETVSSVEYYTGKRTVICVDIRSLQSCVTEPVLLYRPVFTRNGDGTVTTPSAIGGALGGVQSGAGNTYYFDLARYNHDRPLSSVGGFLAHQHANIFEAQPLRDFIQNIVIATSTEVSALPVYISTTTPVREGSTSLWSRLHFFLHSPLHMHVINSAGLNEEENPDARREMFGEVQYISVPAGQEYTVRMDAFQAGSFTFEIQKTEGDIVVASTTYSGYPVATTSVASVNVPADIFTSGVIPEMHITYPEEQVTQNSTTSPQVSVTSSGGSTVNFGSNGSASYIVESSVARIDSRGELLAAHIEMRGPFDLQGTNVDIPQSETNLVVLKDTIKNNTYTHMFTKDPIQHFEGMVKEAHDSAGKFTQPTLKRYPLLFTFLLTFSVAAVLHGFELMTDEIVIFRTYPSLLILIGVVALFLTGTLYKLLEKGQ